MSQLEKPEAFPLWYLESPLIRLYLYVLIAQAMSSLVALVVLSFGRYLISSGPLTLGVLLSLLMSLSPLLALQRLREEAPEDALVMTQIFFNKLKKYRLGLGVFLVLCFLPSVLVWSNTFSWQPPQQVQCQILERSSPGLKASTSDYYMTLDCAQFRQIFMSPPPLKHWSDFSAGKPLTLHYQTGWLGWPFWVDLTPPDGP